MSFFDKFSADKLKDAAAVAKKKLGDAAAKGAEAATAASQMVKDFDYQEAQATAKRTASNIADHAGKATTKAIDTVMEHDYAGTRDYLADQAVKASDGVVNMKVKWSTKTGHRVRVFSSIDFPIRLVVTHHYIRAVLVRCNIQRYSPLLRELHR